MSATLEEPQTRERELRALAEGMREFGIDTSTVVTVNESGTIEVEGGVVNVVPAWRWLLEG